MDPIDRRKLFRKLVSLAALGAVTSLLLGDKMPTVSAGSSTAHYGDVWFDDGTTNNTNALPSPNFHWDNNNLRLGVGTGSPQATLDVSGREGTSLSTGTTGMTAMFSSPTGPNISHIHYGLTGDWYIRSASSSGKVVIQDSGGMVGIGTTVPTSPLHVVGLPVYANNADAIAGGLTAGALYRTGADPDPVYVVH